MMNSRKIIGIINYQTYAVILLLLINTTILVGFNNSFSEAHVKAVESRKQLQQAINDLSVAQQNHANDRYDALNKRVDSLFKELVQASVIPATKPSTEPSTEPTK